MTFSLLLAVANPRQTASSMLLVTKWVLPSAIATETPEPWRLRAAAWASCPERVHQAIPPRLKQGALYRESLWSCGHGPKIRSGAVEFGVSVVEKSEPPMFP